MKKLLLALVISAMANVSYAACLGDSGICWGDGKTSAINLQLRLPSMTTTQMNAYTPSDAGELWLITGTTIASVCVSSGASRGGFTVVTSTAVGPASMLHCQ